MHVLNVEPGARRGAWVKRRGGWFGPRRLEGIRTPLIVDNWVHDTVGFDIKTNARSQIDTYSRLLM